LKVLRIPSNPALAGMMTYGFQSQDTHSPTWDIYNLNM